MSGSSQLTAIPVIASSTLALWALFDAALTALPWDVTLAESLQPGAAAALRAWAESRGIDATDDLLVETDERLVGYANLVVLLDGATRSRIVVLAYSALHAAGAQGK